MHLNPNLEATGEKTEDTRASGDQGKLTTADLGDAEQVEAVLCLTKRTAYGNTRLRHGYGRSVRVVTDLELGIGSEGHGHPLFKALEPWEARQIKRCWGEHRLSGGGGTV